MSPAKVETFPGAPLLKPTAMPVTAVITPALLMPPVNVAARLTSMPVMAEMLPALLMLETSCRPPAPQPLTHCSPGRCHR
jgi:hypothetical protein